jgi:hypothetical protein
MTENTENNTNTGKHDHDIRALAADNAAHARKTVELETARKALEAELTSTKAAREAAEAKITATTSKTQERIIRSELKSLAKEYGMVDLDGLKMLDFSKVELDADDNVIGAEDIIKAAKASKPYLFKDIDTSSKASAPKSDSNKKEEWDFSDPKQKALFKQKYGY